MYFKKFLQYSLLLTGSISVMCQKAGNGIGIFTVEGDSVDAYNSINQLLKQYNLKYDVETVKIPKKGVNDNQLNNYLYKKGTPKYKAIVFPNGKVPYNKHGNWTSALKDPQWNTFYDYSRKHGSRLVFLNEFPSAFTGTNVHPTYSTNSQLCTARQRITAAPGTPHEQIINNQLNLNTEGIYHYFPIIENAQNVTTKPLLYFEPNEQITDRTVAAVEVDNAGAKISAYFLAFGDWSNTSKVLNILWMSWATEQDFKMLSADQISTEQALLQNGNNNGSAPSSSDAGRNGKLEMLFITLSILFTLLYLL